MLRHLLILVFSIFKCYVSAQPYLDDVPAKFSRISARPNTFVFTSQKAGDKGGHLQGIQIVPYGPQLLSFHIIATASSSKISYYVTGDMVDVYDLKISGIPKVCDKRKIAVPPYRHAGGCQAAGNVWAVGVEDNVNKNKSKVLLFSTDTNAKPITIAERTGAYERSTAGATGLVRLKDGSYLAAVGDWDSRNIDFYQSNPNNVAAFDSIATYKADTISTWGSYQSINLLQQADGKLYMIGFCLDVKGSRADLFSITLDGTAKLQPITSRYFKTTKGTSFRYGAGIHVTDSKKMTLMACARNLKKGKNYFSIWW